MCLLEESWPVGHCGRLRVRALGFCVVFFFFSCVCMCVCVPWWGRGVSHATPWGRRRIGQTRWKSVCTSRKHWPGDCLWWTRARATQLTTDVSTHMKNNNKNPTDHQSGLQLDFIKDTDGPTMVPSHASPAVSSQYGNASGRLKVIDLLKWHKITMSV